MRVLADTNLFIRFSRRLPLPRQVEDTFLDPSTDRHLSPASIMELFRLWRKGAVPDNPDSWLDLALPSWVILPVTVPIARQSILWTWEQRDPADRLLAATAAVHGLELWHTDTILRSRRNPGPITQLSERPAPR